MKKTKLVALTLVTLLTTVSVAYADKLYLEKIVGTGDYGDRIGASAQALFRQPYGLITDKNGKVYFTDAGNNKIKKLENDKVVLVSGKVGKVDQYNMPIGSFKDGSLKDGEFNKPKNMAVDKSGNIFIADTGNNIIRKISGSTVKIVAGNGVASYGDGKNEKVSFNKPTGIAIDDAGNIYVADTGNNVIRKIDKDGLVSTYAGKYAEIGAHKDGNIRDALFNEPTELIFKGNDLYVVDSGNSSIRKINNGVVSTVIGYVAYDLFDKDYAITGDTSTKAKYSKMNFPKGIDILADETIVVADTWNKKLKYLKKDTDIFREYKLLKKVVANGITTEQTININGPADVLMVSGKLYVTDIWDNCIYVFKLESENDNIPPKPTYAHISDEEYNYMYSVSYFKNGRLIMPMKNILKALGAEITWLEDSREIVAETAELEMKINPYSDYSVIINGTTYIDPLYLKEMYGIDLKYDKYVKCVINNNEFFEKPLLPYKDNGKVLIPVRGLLEKCGAKVTWLPDTQEILISKDGKNVVFKPNSQYSKMINERTMVEYEYIKNALNLKLRYDESQNTMYVEN